MPTHRTEFTYDFLDRRVRVVEKESSVVVSDSRYLWDGLEILEQRDASGGTVVQRFFAEGFSDASGGYSYTRDHLGSIREITDSSQTVRARYDYDPYGRMTKLSGDKDASFLYTGHFWHAPSGLYLAPFRAYDPDLGRWISRDPIGEKGGVNLYAYVKNSPISKTDPLGLWDGNVVYPYPIFGVPGVGGITAPIGVNVSDINNPEFVSGIKIELGGASGELSFHAPYEHGEPYLEGKFKGGSATGKFCTDRGEKGDPYIPPWPGFPGPPPVRYPTPYDVGPTEGPVVFPPFLGGAR